MQRLALFTIVAAILFLGAGDIAASQTAAALDLDGKSVDPLHLSAGKIVVLVFVRTDCPISNRYAPAIQRLSSKFSGDASFWLVYVDKKESTETIRRHNMEYGYKLPALRDAKHELVKLTGAQITPEAAVFDKQRHLVYHGRIDDWYKELGRAQRAATTHELEDAIRSAIGGTAPPVAAAPAVGCYISDLE